MRVDVHYMTSQQGPFEPLMWAAGHLREMNIHLDFKASPPPASQTGKLLITHQHFLPPDMIEHHKTIIMIERVDAAIVWARAQVNHPHVKMVLKNSILRDPLENNSTAGRYHSVKFLGVPQKKPSSLLSEEGLKKIKAAPSYYAYQMLQPLSSMSVDFTQARPVDVHFAGTVNYSDRTEITTHRENAVKAIQDLGSQVTSIVRAGKAISRDAYWAEMFSSKACLSPWGFGEMCYRDYEAILTGAVLIKPQTDHVFNDPDILIPNETYIPCRVDFADVPEILERVKSEWPLRGLRERAYNMVRQVATPKAVAQRYRNLFSEIGLV